MSERPASEESARAGSPPWRALAVLCAAQVLVVLAWYLVEARRDGGVPVARESGTIVAAEQTTRIDRAAPALALVRRDGSTFTLAAEADGRPLLLHFWATWCPPCLEELPSLLEWAEQGEVEVIAASLDRDWAAVGRLFGDSPPPQVVRASAQEVSERLDVVGLPVTFVIAPSGRMRLRLDGPRDWASRRLRESVLDQAR